MEQDNNRELVRSSDKKLLTTYKPDKLVRVLEQVSTCSDAVRVAEGSPHLFPSLARLKKDFSGEKIETLIKAYLIYLCDMVNLKRPLNEPQINMIAREVMARFYSLTMADVHVIFRSAICGDYGTFYESLDVPKVLGWFTAYFEEKCTIGADQAISSNTDKNGNMTFENAIKQFRK